MERVPVFVISPVGINILIIFKAFPQVLQVCGCVGKVFTKEHQGPLRQSIVIFLLHIKVVCFIFMYMWTKYFLNSIVPLIPLLIDFHYSLYISIYDYVND